MKKLLVVLALTLSLAANAAWEKVGGIQVADVNALVTGVTKLGEFTGNAMLGLMASSSVTKLPFYRFFGPGREGTPLALIVFYNGEDFEYAVLYPVVQTQAEFLKRRPGTVDGEGVIKMKEIAEDAEPGAEDFDGFTYVAFSKDGKWAAVSDKHEQARLAILETALAEKPMGGDLIRLGIGKNGMALIRKAIEVQQLKESLGAEKEGDRFLREVLGECEALVCGVTVDDKGLAVRGALKAVKDSRLAKCGLTPLADNPLAFATKDALGAYAQAKDCGQSHVTFSDLQTLFRRHGLKMDFVTAEELGGGVNRFTLDIPAAIAYFKGATNELEKIDSEKLSKDVARLVEFQESFRVENPAMAGSIAVKGYTTAATPAERVAAILPELKSQKPYQVQVYSLYATVKAVMPHVLDAMESDDRAAFQSVWATLPPEGKGGIANALWREGDAHHFLVRVSADEFKCVSTGFSAFMIYAMQNAQKEKARKD